MTLDTILSTAKDLSREDLITLIGALVDLLPAPLTAEEALSRAALRTALPDDGHFGEHVLAVLDTLDLSVFDDPLMDDPVEYLKRLRASRP